MFVSIVYVDGLPLTLPPPKLYVIVYVIGLYVTVHVVSFVMFVIVTVLFCIVPFWLFVHVTVGLEYPVFGVVVNVVSSPVFTSLFVSVVVPFSTLICTVCLLDILHVVLFVTLFIVIIFPSIFPLWLFVHVIFGFLNVPVYVNVTFSPLFTSFVLSSTSSSGFICTVYVFVGQLFFCSVPSACTSIIPLNIFPISILWSSLLLMYSIFTVYVFSSPTPIVCSIIVFSSASVGNVPVFISLLFSVMV